MNKVTSVIQETMQKGRAIVSDRKLGKEGYVRLGEIYEEGFDRIGECVSQSGQMPELSASWVKASREIAELREESLSDGKAVLRRYEAFFKEATQLAGGMIGGSVGQVLQRTSSPIPVEVNPASEGTPGNSVEGMNVRWTDNGDDRIVTMTRPAKSLLTIYYNEINAMPNRKQDGIWKDSPLMQGPKEDDVPGNPTEVTFTIHFGTGGKTREDHEAFLAGQGADGEQFADPFLVAAAEGWLRAKTGESLFKFKRDKYVVRTARSETKNGVPVLGLYSYADGVSDNDYVGDNRFPYIVAVGASNQKT